jgi:ATP-binding cassette subfamily B protein
METQSIQALETRYSGRRPMRTLLHVFDGDWLRLGIATFFFVIKHSPVWAMPIIVAGIINVVTGQGERPLSELYRYAAIMAVLIAQNIPSHMLFIRFYSRSVRNMEARLRSALVRKMQQLSIAFHDDFRSGTLHAKVLRDVESMEMLARQFMQAVFPAFLSICFAFVVTVKKEPAVALFYLFTVPVSALLIRTFRGKVRSHNAEYRGEVEVMSARVSEMIEMIPVTRAHGAENLELDKMRSQLKRVRDRGIRLDQINALFASSSWVSFQAFHLLCLGVTGTMAYRGRIPVGDVVMYQGFFMMIVGAVSAILNIYPILARGMESIRSMGEILECPDIEENRGKRRVPSVTGDISFEQVDLVYDEQAGPAVRDFTLRVEAGETIALIGESGSGKTSVMNLLVGFRRPGRGRILLDGVDMQELDLRDFRQHLSVVSQNTILFAGTIRENITYGLHSVSDEQLERAVRMANVAEFVERLPEGLESAVGEHGARLSGGQRQRIAIARALIRDPRVIIFDEATSALDVVSEALVQEAIDRLITGRTTFIVAHRLSTIRHADRIVVMREGHIIETGTHASLLAARGEYYRMKQLQTT